MQGTDDRPQSQGASASLLPSATEIVCVFHRRLWATQCCVCQYNTGRKIGIETRHAMYAKQNVEARSRNHCCRGKAISIIYSECVCCLSYPAHTAHAPYYIVTCGLSGCTIFFTHYLINCTIFGKMLLNIKCVFWFSLQLLSETFLILRRIQRDIIINVHRSSCRVPVVLVRF
jgi:hypothetical protein